MGRGHGGRAPTGASEGAAERCCYLGRLPVFELVCQHGIVPSVMSATKQTRCPICSTRRNEAGAELALGPEAQGLWDAARQLADSEAQFELGDLTWQAEFCEDALGAVLHVWGNSAGEKATLNERDLWAHGATLSARLVSGDGRLVAGALLASAE